MNISRTVGWVTDTASRVFLAGVFLYASWSKIEDPSLFLDAVKSYRMLPDFLSGWIAIVLPSAERVAGLSLLVTRWSREAALMLFSMLLIFLVGLTQAWVRGLEISCGCFGPDDGTPAPLWLDIVRDIGLLIPAVWLMVRPNRWLFGR